MAKRASYRYLCRNAKSAMLAAVEIYNKPRIDYRDETVVILLLNAWELLLKAVIARSGQTIFYKKKRGELHKTFSIDDAFAKSIPLFPPSISAIALKSNLETLALYRDNAIHFYNKHGFDTVIYALSQTCIVNFKDLLLGVFGIDIGRDISWRIMPVGVNPPIDPIDYIASATSGKKKVLPAIRDFLVSLTNAAKKVQAQGSDTGRLLTVFDVHLQSVKKIGRGDVVVGISSSEAATRLATKQVDPNISHPLLQKDVLKKIGRLHGAVFNRYAFQAIVWKYQFKQKPHMCWIDSHTRTTRYAKDMVSFINKLSHDDLNSCLLDYKNRQSRKLASKPRLPHMTNAA